MKPRAYVMIFFFWALLTIVTPILVGWSQSLKNPTQLDNDDQEHKFTNGPRRMMGSYLVEMHLLREIFNWSEEKELLMEPSMAPMPSSDQTLISHELAIT